MLFDTFDPNEIKNNFKWEYPVGVPQYGTGNTEAKVDVIFADNLGKWVAIEIELVEAGKELKEELVYCIHKLKTPECRKFMARGYIIPLLTRMGEKKARGYGITYSDLLEETINNAENEIGDSPIEILKGGILFQ